MYIYIYIYICVPPGCSNLLHWLHPRELHIPRNSVHSPTPSFSSQFALHLTGSKGPRSRTKASS